MSALQPWQTSLFGVGAGVLSLRTGSFALGFATQHMCIEMSTCVTPRALEAQTLYVRLGEGFFGVP